MYMVTSFLRKTRLGGRKPEMLDTARPNMVNSVQFPISQGIRPPRFLFLPALFNWRFFKLPIELGISRLSWLS